MIFVLNMLVGIVKRKQERHCDAIEHAPAQNRAPVPAPSKEEMIAKH